jgi:hypothetical protein
MDRTTMPSYKIHRLKDHLRQYFRHAPHVSGAAGVKPRDYNPGEAVEAKTPYAAYFDLRGSAAPLEPGDLLETENGELRIFKFVGFEEARWLLPEAKAEALPETSSVVASSSIGEIPIPATVE